MQKYIVTSLLFIAYLLSPIYTEAHVKWFTELEPSKEKIENIITPLFMVISIIVAIILAILPQVLPMIMRWKPLAIIDKKLDGYRKYSRHLLKYGTAIALTIQVILGTIFAPEIEIHNGLVVLLAWAAIALLFIPHHYATKAAAVVLLGLFIHVTTSIGIFHMLDYGFYLAIIFVLLIGNTKLENWGFPFLYLGTGLSLCWVAVEKWVYPTLSIDIIQHHGVPTFGFEPSVFVILSAFIEFVVGYLLVVGILNRLLAFVLTGIFILTTTVFGWLELAGHFMIHIILIIFIIEGISFYKPPIKMHDSIINQIIFVFLNFIFVLATFLLIYYRFA